MLTATPTEEIFLDFSYRSPEIRDISGDEYSTTHEWIGFTSANFTQSEIASFMSHAQFLVRRDISPRLWPRIGRRAIEDEVKLTLELYYGAEAVSIDSKMAVVLRRIAKECLSLDGFVILGIVQDIEYQDLRLPKEWLLSVLEYVEVPQVEVRRDCLVLTTITSQPDRERKIAGRLCLQQLVHLYRMGCIATDDVAFVERWNLVAVNGNLCAPKWDSFLITSDRAKFLLKAQAGRAQLQLSSQFPLVVKSMLGGGIVDGRNLIDVTSYWECQDLLGRLEAI